MAKHKLTMSTLIVTNPGGKVTQRPVRLSYTPGSDLYEITLIGESQLKGYSMGVVGSELRRVFEHGQDVDELPKVE